MPLDIGPQMRMTFWQSITGEAAEPLGPLFCFSRLNHDRAVMGGGADQGRIVCFDLGCIVS
jgi:hypothetical protein